GASLVAAAATGAARWKRPPGNGSRTAARLGTKSPSPDKESVVSELSPDYFNRPVAEVDPEIAEVLRGELERERRTLEMIASENFVPRAVLECQGSVLTRSEEHTSELQSREH